MTKFEMALLCEAIRYHMGDPDSMPGYWEDAMDLLAYLQNGKGYRTCNREVRQFIRDARRTHCKARRRVTP